MNRDEILKLEAGRELDALIAQTFFKHQYVYSVDSEKGLQRTFPFFSKDISAAWEVLEKLSEKYECSTAVGREYPYQRMTYVARCVGGKLAYDNPDLRMWAFANTAELAVCRLALLAVLEGRTK